MDTNNTVELTHIETELETAKSMIKETGLFYESTINNTKVELTKSVRFHEVEVEQGVIVIEENRVSDISDILKYLSMGYVMIEDRKDWMDEDAIKSYLNLIPRLIESANKTQIDFEDSLRNKLGCTYDKEKGRLYIPAFLVDFEVPSIILIISNGNLIIMNEDKTFGTKIEDKELLLSTKIKLTFSSVGTRYYAKLPKKLIESVDLTDNTFKMLEV